MNLDISFISEKAKDFIRKGAKSYKDYYLDVSVDCSLKNSVLLACDADDECKKVYRNDDGDSFFVALTFDVSRCLLIDCDSSLTNYVDDCILFDSFTADGDHVNYRETWEYEDEDAIVNINIGENFIRVSQSGDIYDLEFEIKNLEKCLS